MITSLWPVIGLFFATQSPAYELCETSGDIYGIIQGIDTIFYLGNLKSETLTDAERFEVYKLSSQILKRIQALKPSTEGIQELCDAIAEGSQKIIVLTKPKKAIKRSMIEKPLNQLASIVDQLWDYCRPFSNGNRGPAAQGT